MFLPSMSPTTNIMKISCPRKFPSPMVFIPLYYGKAWHIGYCISLHQWLSSAVASFTKMKVIVYWNCSSEFDLVLCNSHEDRTCTSRPAGFTPSPQQIQGFRFMDAFTIIILFTQQLHWRGYLSPAYDSSLVPRNLSMRAVNNLGFLKEWHLRWTWTTGNQ